MYPRNRKNAAREQLQIVPKRSAVGGGRARSGDRPPPVQGCKSVRIFSNRHSQAELQTNKERSDAVSRKMLGPPVALRSRAKEGHL